MHSKLLKTRQILWKHQTLLFFPWSAFQADSATCTSKFLIWNITLARSHPRLTTPPSMNLISCQQRWVRQAGEFHGFQEKAAAEEISVIRILLLEDIQDPFHCQEARIPCHQVRDINHQDLCCLPPEEVELRTRSWETLLWRWWDMTRTLASQVEASETGSAMTGGASLCQSAEKTLTAFQESTQGSKLCVKWQEQ